MRSEKDLSENDNTKANLIAEQQIIYQGEFPHPDILKGFAEIIPDMPK